MPRYTGPGARSIARRAASRTSLGTCSGSRPRRPTWSRTRTGGPGRSPGTPCGIARCDAWPTRGPRPGSRPERLGQGAGHVRRPGAVGTVDEGRSSAQAGIRIGHVDRGASLRARTWRIPTSLHGDPERVVAPRHEEEVLDADGLQFVRDRRGRVGGRGCCYRRRDGRDGIHRDGRGDHGSPKEKVDCALSRRPSAGW